MDDKMNISLLWTYFEMFIHGKNIEVEVKFPQQQYYGYYTSEFAFTLNTFLQDQNVTKLVVPLNSDSVPVGCNLLNIERFIAGLPTLKTLHKTEKVYKDTNLSYLLENKSIETYFFDSPDQRAFKDSLLYFNELKTKIIKILKKDQERQVNVYLWGKLIYGDQRKGYIKLNTLSI